MASSLINLASRAASELASTLGRLFGRTQGVRKPAPAAPSSTSRRRIRPGRSPRSGQDRIDQLAQALGMGQGRTARTMTEFEEPEDTNAPWDAVGGIRNRRSTTDIDRVNQGQQERVSNNDPLFTGEMINVDSSNVHSIGFLLEGVEQAQPHQGAVLRNLKGTLLVRYLDRDGEGTRAGPGPLYGYQDVPATLFMAFQRAPSKGIWVWENLRVRGTVTGHKFAYDFMGSESSYIPRQAALRRGQGGQHFIRRTFQGQSSRLPEEMVNRAGPNRGRPATTGGVRGAGQGRNRGGVQGLRFIKGSGRAR